MKYVIIGTAGHIDHGKTSLIKAMTGIDTDRLPEEKKRGITIDIGFAHHQLTPRLRVSFIDVPGHERLVKNMIAGACGIDMVLLVVAADEGVMPQTVEHVNICRILGLKRAVVALNKADKVDEETLRLAEEEVREFLARTPFKDAPVVPVSARTGEGIERLKEEIERVALAVEGRRGISPFRLPVDRVFVVKGFGTVVTGTVFSGRVRVGETVELLPQGATYRVRNIQVQGEDVEEASVGVRAALNLQGLEKADVDRGDAVCSPGAFAASDVLDCRVFLLEGAPPLKDMAPVRVHIGTKEAIGRVKLLEVDTLRAQEECYCRIHLEEPVVAANLDPVVIRSYSPVFTIGGGVVLDAHPEKVRIKRAHLAERLRMLDGCDERRRLELFLLWSPKGVERGALALKGIDPWGVEGLLKEMVGEEALEAGGRIFHRKRALELVERMEKAVQELLSRDKLRGAVSFRELSHVLGLSEDVVAALALRSKRLKVVSGGVTLEGERGLDPETQRLVAAFEAELKRCGLQPPSVNKIFDRLGVPPKLRGPILRYLLEKKRAVRVNTEIVIHSSALDRLVAGVENHFKKERELAVSQMKGMFGLSRKYAIPYLEFLDRLGITKRVGNVRVKR